MIPLAGWVLTFNEKFDHDRTDETRAACWTTIRARLKKLKHELDHSNRSGLARQTAELVYDLYGAAELHAIDLDIAIREVHLARMGELQLPSMTAAIVPTKDYRGSE